MARAIELAVERLGRGPPILFVHGDTSEGQALAAVARLREMTPPIGRSSAGAAIWDGSETLDELLRRADVAPYTAKTDGGSVVQVVPPTLESSAAFARTEPAAD